MYQILVEILLTLLLWSLYVTVGLIGLGLVLVLIKHLN